MGNQKFYKCNICGNIVGMIKSMGPKVVCCNQEMELLVANKTDGALEKHVPIVKQNGNVVSVVVGEVEHPMTSEHYIEWIYLETTQGGKRKALEPNSKPSAEFTLSEGEEIVAVYSYCNLHGLWEATI